MGLGEQLHIINVVSVHKAPLAALYSQAPKEKSGQALQLSLSDQTYD
ncbi:hypothetical protein DFO77_10770 [Marinilabilia salmonicolor]|uniref:Uncharacterized protein n=1 Tax=Marinilabilia salmonicolor TaxID=989 RepID=A0A368V6R3_9BACT|nr:hypothetical protein DFO77_10770 [Marinilabilia salmonicolor]